MVSMKRVMIPTCLALVIVAGTSLISSRAQATRAPGQQPSASGPPPSVNPLNVALPKRYPANQSTPIDGVPLDVGKQPYGVAFDGQCIWTANSGDGTVTKLRPGNGKIVGSFKVGGAPVGLAFDGANIWVTNSDDATVTKLRASDGKVLGTFAVGKQPWWLAFDGANIWVADFGDHGVTKLRASDGKNLGTFNTGGAIEGSQVLAIAGSKFGYAVVAEICDPDIGTVESEPPGLLANCEGSQNFSVAGSQLGNGSVVTIRDPDV